LSAVVSVEQVLAFLMERMQDGLLPWSAQNSASVQFGLSHAEVEALAMQNDISPARYQRNRNMISVAEQLLLFGSCIAVVGCGGLGGYVIEELARLGIGRIVAIDPDIFEEHNLNRQLFSSISALGKAKVEVALTRVNEINPAVTLTAIKDTYCSSNGRELLCGATVVVDALDNITTRLDLAETCAELQIPLVFGAIGGWYGQVSTQLPGDSTIQNIFRNGGAAKGVETKLGNPSFTPALVASLQVAEVCKLVLGRGALLRNRILVIDLHDMEFHEIANETPPDMVPAANEHR
jgi:molybdopterin-synthase adenylyltransferase